MIKTYPEAAFAFFSANLHRFAPAIGWEAHRALYERFIGHHRARAKHHLPCTWTGLQHIATTGILAAFHLGNHEMLPIRLAEAGLPFDILLSKKVHGRYTATLEKHRQHFKTLGREVAYIFAEERTAILQVRNSIRRQRHILIFADGNLGTEAEKNNLHPVHFLQSTLWVKPGIAFLSHVFQTPVYPIVDMDEQDALAICVKEPIRPEKKEDRKAYIHRCMQCLYRHLEERLRPDMTHWGCWSELHLNGMLDVEHTDGHAVQHTEPALVDIQVGGASYRFDRANYKVYRLTSEHV